ncbi:MAG: ribonuclease HII [Bacilli bacterium]|nr:ribonuclease HII [Bacilli bacterium]
MGLYDIERQLNKAGYQYILGTDEAGRGPMAGPLVASAVILPVGYYLEGLNDSKKLSSKLREKLYDIIMTDALNVETEIISSEEVDRINVFQASKKAMLACIKRMKKIDYVLTDAMKLDINLPCLALIKGDSKSASIAAASVIAKVTRDRLMIEYDKIYPEYGFKKHKGYVTKLHLETLKEFGPCPLHRTSFEPVQRELYKQTKFVL